MEAEFWHERWEKDEIGFHQPDYNRHLQAYIDRLQLAEGAHVLVPLCGKSLDMLWLRDRGYRVSGIEINRKAVEEFFRENRISCERIPGDGFSLYRAEGIVIAQGDLFAMDTAWLAPVDAVYDRASLIALPRSMRPAYVERLDELTPGGIRTLLLTLDYEQDEMKGPPFSVNDEEVSALYGGKSEVRQLHTEDCLAREPRFRQKGLRRLDERVFLLRKIS